MVLALAAIALYQAQVHPGMGPKDGQTWHLRISRTVSTDFLLTIPEEYAKDHKKRWPMLVFLHGSGECGTDLSKVSRHGPPKEIANGRKFPFIVVSPQCPDDFWDPAVVTQLVDMIERRYRVDRDREYVTGLSLGGYGAYELAAANPGRFAAIAPISGGGTLITALQLRRTPAYIVHGTRTPRFRLRKIDAWCST